MISIILPIYNGAKTLKNCLDSLINQTYKDIEIICINDGSSDNTKEILDEYSVNYNNIKCFHIANSGVFAARAEGICHAEGQYIGFVDCDDIVSPFMFERLYSTVIKTNSDMAVCGYKRIDKDSNIVLTEEMCSSKNESYYVDNDKSQLIGINTALWNKIIKTDIVKKYIKLDNAPRMLEDMMFLLGIYPHIKKICFVNEPLYYYYYSNNSVMLNVSQKDITETMEAMISLKSHLDIKEIYVNDLVDAMAFVHFGVSLILGVSHGDIKKTKKLHKIIYKWLQCNFPNWKKNNYFLFKNVMKNKNALIKPYIVLQTYKLGVFPVFLKLYVILGEKNILNVKW